MAVGTGGAVLTSTDGTNWATRPRIDERPDFQHVAFGNACFVAITTDAISYTSDDGIAWTRRSVAGGSAGLAYGNGIFLSYSSDGQFSTSNDGIAWVARPTGIGLRASSAVYDGTRFIVATDTDVYLTTVNGSSWTTGNFGAAGKVRRIIYGNGRYLTESRTSGNAVSTDLVTWITAYSGLQDFTFVNDIFVDVHSYGAGVRVSSDALVWSERTRLTPNVEGQVNSLLEDDVNIAFGNGVYVMIATSGYWFPDDPSGPSGSVSMFFSSTDGRTWKSHGRFFVAQEGLAYGRGMFVAGKYVSSDGINWARGGFGLYLGRSDFRYEFAGDRFFALQGFGAGQVFVSEDGETATEILHGNGLFLDIAHGGGMFVLVGSAGKIATSSDTKTWRSHVGLETTNLTSVTHGQGVFVVAGESNRVLVSSDGLAWSVRSLPAAADASTSLVEFGNGSFVLLRQNGELLVSSDALVWTAHPKLDFSPVTLKHANATFVASAEDGEIYTSVDGVTWVSRKGHSTSAIKSFAFGNGTWIGQGWNQALLFSATASEPTSPPRIETPPRSRTIVGDATGMFLMVTATGTGPFTYQWFEDGQLIPDATKQTHIIVKPVVAVTEARDYHVVVTGPGGAATSSVARITINPPSAPVFSTEPVGFQIPLHGNGELSAYASTIGEVTYQWLKNGKPIGPPAPYPANRLKLRNAAPQDSGYYEVLATNAGGTTKSSAVRVDVEHSRLSALSARAQVASGADILIAGFVVANDNAPASDEPWSLVIRGVGPSLKDLGVAQYLANPNLKLYQLVQGQQSLRATNEDWGLLPDTERTLYSSLAAQVGAFELPVSSFDAALVHQSPQLSFNTTPQIYTAHISGADGQTGVALAEIYDASLVHARLMAISARARVASGENVLIAGFVIDGTKPLKVLLRGVGPALAAQGVATALSNPKITLFDRIGRPLETNDDWGTASNLSDLRAAITATGASPLSDGSKDAAMLVTLDPGIYTVHVTSVDGSSGVALAEIYEAP